MVIRGLERKMGRDVKDMENPKKERCQLPRERKERGRGDKNEPDGETEMGMFWLGRARGR